MRASTDHLDILMALPPPWACCMVCELTAVPRLFSRETLPIDGIVMRTVRGERCLSRGELHQEWGEAWRFPPTRSHQWGAFPEEITDMGWWHAKNYLTVITQAHRLFEDASTNRQRSQSTNCSPNDSWNAGRTAKTPRRERIYHKDTESTKSDLS